MELPSAFVKRMQQMLGEEYQEFAESYDRERTQGLRLNLLKTDSETFLKDNSFHLKPIPWTTEGYYYSSEDRPGRHPWHEAGVYYIQEPSAMAVVTFLDPKPGECILDLCAAPGGKTTQIASRLGGTGLLVSNEIHPARAKILSQNVERMGIPNAVVTNEDSARLAQYFPSFFDRIVVDAPCSGEGMFRKDETAVSEWSPENVRRCAGRQQEILDNAAKMLKSGGRLVYSTCTFAPEENEKSIQCFLNSHPDFTIEETPKYEGLSAGVPEWGILPENEAKAPQESSEDGEPSEGGEAFAENPRLAETVRIWPHRTDGEGHYIAVLKKDGIPETVKRKLPLYLKDKRLLADVFTFCRETFREPEPWNSRKEWILFGDQLYLLPPQMPDFDRLRVLRAGLQMGTLKKNRFEPSHALALALQAEEVRRARNFTAESETAAAYLRGEALSEELFEPEETEEKGEKKPAKGWTLMTVDGYSIGWAKLAGGVLKNHYPKGLRR